MRRSLVGALAALSLGLLPAPSGAQEAAPIDCGSGDGRERLTTQGFQATFDAPTGTVPVPAYLRSGQFHLTADLAPYSLASASVKLTWADANYDYDLYVYDSDGSLIGSSIAVGTNSEEVVADLTHCQDFRVEVRNYSGIPDHQLTLAATVTGYEDQKLACAESDPARGCAGKAAGEPPDLVPDTRVRLYLGGDPGQVSMVYAYVGNDSLPKGRLESTRPTAGRPNQYTRPVVGFRDQYRNPFVAHWTTDLEQPRTVQGAVRVLVWASSASEDASGTLYIDFYADGGLAGQATVPGDRIGATPTPLFVTVPIVEPVEAANFGLQIATNPAVASNGPGNPRDAHVTLYYGSVQFPARVTLP